MDAHPRVYNYYALALAVCNPRYSVDMAIDYFSAEADRLDRRTRGELKAEEMLRLRQQGMTNTEVGRIFGISKSAVSHLIHRRMGAK